MQCGAPTVIYQLHSKSWLQFTRYEDTGTLSMGVAIFRGGIRDFPGGGVAAVVRGVR